MSMREREEGKCEREVNMREERDIKWQERK